MKIEWLDRNKLVPAIGSVITGREYTVSEEIGESLVQQGQAKEVEGKPITKKKGGTD